MKHEGQGPSVNAGALKRAVHSNVQKTKQARQDTSMDG